MSTKKTIVFHDRYSATGTPRPDPKTMCKRCDGMGYYPDMDKHRRGECSLDKVPFVKCEVCKGTRLRPGASS